MVQMVKVRILEYTRETAVVFYDNKEYSVDVADLSNVNAGWTYGFISVSKLTTPR